MPTIAKTTPYLKQSPGQGGLAAKRVYLNELRRERAEDPTLRPHFEVDIWLVHKDLQNTRHSLRRAAKRKSAPNWSIPLELLLFLLDHRANVTPKERGSSTTLACC